MNFTYTYLSSGYKTPARIAIAATYTREQVRQFKEICQAVGLKVVVFSALPPASAWLGLDLLETNLAAQVVAKSLKRAFTPGLIAQLVDIPTKKLMGTYSLLNPPKDGETHPPFGYLKNPPRT